MIYKIKCNSFLYLFVLISLFLLFLIIFHSELPIKIKSKLFGGTFSEQRLTSDPYYMGSVGAHRLLISNFKNIETVIIGDSIACSLLNLNENPSVVNLGISGDTLWGVLNRWFTVNSLQNHRNLIILAGVNDLRFFDDDKILKSSISIINQFDTELRYLWIGMIPVDFRDQKKSNYWNSRIRAINSQMESHLKSLDHVIFIDPAIVFSDKSNYLADDGLHLNEIGKKKLIEEVYKYL